MQPTETPRRIGTAKPTACTCSTSPAVIQVSDAALLLGMSEEYFYVGMRAGVFPSVNRGRSRALPMSFIRGFVAEVVEVGLPTSLEDYAKSWFAARIGAVA